MVEQRETRDSGVSVLWLRQSITGTGQATVSPSHAAVWPSSDPLKLSQRGCWWGLKTPRLGCEGSEWVVTCNIGHTEHLSGIVPLLVTFLTGPVKPTVGL